MGKKMTVPMAHKDFFDGLVSEWTIYKAIREHKLPCVKVCKRILLDEDALNQWWDEEQAKSVMPEPTEDAGKIRRLK